MQRLASVIEEKASWKVLGRLYKLLATQETQSILKQLIDSEKISSKQLQKNSKVPESQFYPIIKQLVECAIIEKKVSLDRSVTYSLGSFGKNVLHLSIPILNKIKELEELSVKI